MGSKYLNYTSAGALGCIAASLTAGTGWRRRKVKDATFNCEVEMYLNLLWKFLKPVSFGLIGKEVNFAVLSSNVVLFGFVTLLVGVLFRLVFGYFSFCGSNMNWKERAYITLSGFPKATGEENLAALFMFTQTPKSDSDFTFMNSAFSSSRSRARSTRLGTVPTSIRRGAALTGTERFSHLGAGNHFNGSIR